MKKTEMKTDSIYGFNRRRRRQPQKGGSEQIGVKARACKRLADANAAFCGKGAMTERASFLDG